MQSYISIVVMALMISSCTDSSHVNRTIVTILDSLDRSTETRIESKPIQDSSVVVHILKQELPVDAFLLVRIDQRSGWFDYRYDIGTQRELNVHVPSDAISLQVGIASSQKIIPTVSSTSVAYTRSGTLALGAYATLIPYAKSFEQAMTIAQLDVQENRSANALLEMFRGVQKDSVLESRLLSTLSSLARHDHSYTEALLAAGFMVAHGDQRKIELQRYLKHCQQQRVMRHPLRFQILLENYGAAELLDTGIVDTLLIPIVRTNSKWSALTQLSYQTKLDSRDQCVPMSHVARAYVAVLPSLTDYEHIQQTSLKVTLAEISYAAGDTATAVALLENVRDITESKYQTYHTSEIDPYWPVDVRSWAQFSVKKLKRWRHENVDEPQVKRPYEIVMVSSNTCGVCRMILNAVRRNAPDTTHHLTIFNTDSKRMEYSTRTQDRLSVEQLRSFASNASAYPTLFLVDQGRQYRKIEGASVDLVRELCSRPSR